MSERAWNVLFSTYVSCNPVDDVIRVNVVCCVWMMKCPIAPYTVPWDPKHTHTLELLLVQVESRCTPTNQPSKNPATDKPTDADMTCEMSFYAIARQCREKVFVWKIWAEGKRTRAASRITSSRVVRVVFDTHTYTPIGKGEHMCPAREGRQGVSARKWCEIEWMIEIVKVHRAKTGYFNRILYWSWSK